MKSPSGFLEGEQAKLRTELAHLKDCQLRYFSLSVTATGVLVSIRTQSPAGRESPLYFLAPLLIVIPCWWIFFDKATTITRIVGYLRLLEDFFRYEENESAGPRFLGWETALQLRRKDPTSSKPATLSDWKNGYSIAVSKVLPLRTTHRYWGFTWYTFLLLAATCIALAISAVASFSEFFCQPGLLGGTIIVFLSALYNLYLVGDLAGGRRSYEQQYEDWCRVHREKKDWRDGWSESEGRSSLVVNKDEAGGTVHEE